MEGNNAFKWGRFEAEVVAGSRALLSGILGYETIRHSFLAVTEWRVVSFFLSLSLENHLEILQFVTRHRSITF